jgi:hypothetical protein
MVGGKFAALAGGYAVVGLMKMSPFLLGEKTEAQHGILNSLSPGGVAESRKTCFLRSAKEIVIVDDYVALKCFPDLLCTAPRIAYSSSSTLI